MMTNRSSRRRSRRPSDSFSRIATPAIALAVLAWSAVAVGQPTSPKDKPGSQASPAGGMERPPRLPTAPTYELRSFLRMDSVRGGEDTLVATVGEPVKLSLALPGGERWETANIGCFQVRTYGRQELVAPGAADGGGRIDYTFAEPGWALVIFCAGPAGEKGKSDSWQRTPYCTKMIVRIDPDASSGSSTDGRREAQPALKDPGITAKVGMKVEILPYMVPSALRFSDEPTHLPVRVYWEGMAQKNVGVVAYGPEGARQEATTGSKGIAHLRITRPGRWLIRYTKEVDGVTYTGELVFDVPAAAPSTGGGR